MGKEEATCRQIVTRGTWPLAMTEAGDLVHDPKRVMGCNQGTYNRILGSVWGHVPIQNVFFLWRSEVFQRKANY